MSMTHEVVVRLTRAEAKALLRREQPPTFAAHPAWSATKKLKSALASDESGRKVVCE